MAEWSVTFTQAGENDLAMLEGSIRRRVIQKLRWLEESFSNIIPLPLHNEWRGFFKLRVGDYRVMYAVRPADHAIIVVRARHRKDVYVV